MNVEIGTEAALFPEKEHINGIAFAVSLQHFSMGNPQSNELTRGTTELVQHFRSQRGVDIGARALLDINLAISLAYPSWKEGVFHSFKWFLPAFATLRGRGGGSAPCGSTQRCQCILFSVVFTPSLPPPGHLSSLYS